MGHTETIRKLTEQLPLNDLGLPEGIYRPDLLPDQAESESESESSAESESRELTVIEGLPSIQECSIAYIPLSYVEGFPSLPDGRPLWSRLDFEPAEAYVALQAYLQQGHDEARQLFLLLDTLNSANLDVKSETPLGTQTTGTAGTAGTAGTHIYTATELQDYFHLYYWGPRARAYDLFRGAHNRHVRQERALVVEDSHFMVAGRLLDVCEACLAKEDFFDNISAQGIAALVKVAAQLQRISVGLPALGPNGARTSKLGPPMHTLMDNTRDLARSPDEDAEAGLETAEDVVRRVLQLNQQINVHVSQPGSDTSQESNLVEAQVKASSGGDKSKTGAHP